MLQYRSVFPNRNTLLVVIHVVSHDQMMRNIKIAQDAGAHGVFLISYSDEVRWSQLSAFYALARKQFPDFWIGVNYLDLNTFRAYNHISDANGLWADDSGICNSGDCSQAEDFQRHRYAGERDFLYFGGVAFKGQEDIDDPALAAKHAMRFMDVITTSGEDTGIPADIEKIRSMKRAIGPHPLALASGVTVENIQTYLQFVDCFLVATGISQSETELDPMLVWRLASIIRSR